MTIVFLYKQISQTKNALVNYINSGNSNISYAIKKYEQWFNFFSEYHSLISVSVIQLFQ